MTVSYAAKVATASFGTFFKLLGRWRGSIYKILFKEFALFATAYFSISFIYMFALNEDQKRYFESVAGYCAKFNDLIPVVFVLGFYVNHVAGLWWDKFRTLPWTGRSAVLVSAHIHGHDERARLMRRTIMRYVCLSYILTMSTISPPVNKRFPTLQHMADAGLLLPNEAKVLTNLKTPYNKFFVPLVWGTSIVSRARKEGRIKDDFAVNKIIDELNDFRTKLFDLLNFNWINLPLVYTQVVTIAVHTFFLTCLLARQRLDSGLVGDFYFPVFTFLQFLFYMGWLKVAETMLNPFGEDDDDFDINYQIDRNLKISYLVVDEMHSEHPELIKDQYWDTTDFDLPHTQESKRYHHTEETQAAAADVEIPLFMPGSVTLTNSLHCLHEKFEERGGDHLSDLPPQSQQSRFLIPRSGHQWFHQPLKSPGVWFKKMRRSISVQNSAASSRRSSVVTERYLSKKLTSYESLNTGVTRSLGGETSEPRCHGADKASELQAGDRASEVILVSLKTSKRDRASDFTNQVGDRTLGTRLDDVRGQGDRGMVDVRSKRGVRGSKSRGESGKRSPEVMISMERLHATGSYMDEHQQDELMFHMSDVEPEDQECCLMRDNRSKNNNNNNNNSNNNNEDRSVSRESEMESLCSSDVVKTRTLHSRTQPSNSQGCNDGEWVGLSLIAEDSPESNVEVKPQWSYEQPAEQQQQNLDSLSLAAQPQSVETNYFNSAAPQQNPADLQQSSTNNLVSLPTNGSPTQQLLITNGGHATEGAQRLHSLSLKQCLPVQNQILADKQCIIRVLDESLVDQEQSQATQQRLPVTQLSHTTQQESLTVDHPSQATLHSSSPFKQNSIAQKQSPRTRWISVARQISEPQSSTAAERHSFASYNGSAPHQHYTSTKQQNCENQLGVESLLQSAGSHYSSTLRHNSTPQKRNLISHLSSAVMGNNSTVNQMSAASRHGLAALHHFSAGQQYSSAGQQYSSTGQQCSSTGQQQYNLPGRQQNSLAILQLNSTEHTRQNAAGEKMLNLAGYQRQSSAVENQPSTASYQRQRSANYPYNPASPQKSAHTRYSMSDTLVPFSSNDSELLERIRRDLRNMKQESLMSPHAMNPVNSNII